MPPDHAHEILSWTMALLPSSAIVLDRLLCCNAQWPAELSYAQPYDLSMARAHDRLAHVSLILRQPGSQAPACGGEEHNAPSYVA